MNPLAQPATVLGGKQSLDAYKGYVDNVLADVEKKKQLAALKQAKIDESLLPPDVNIDDVYRVQTDEIVGQMNELLRTKVDLMSTGVDVESPEYARQIQQAENNLLGQVVNSKQQRALDESVLKTLEDPKASELYDYEATTKKLAEFRSAADKGVKSGDDWLAQNGSILVPKAFDMYKYTGEIAKDYLTSTTSSDPKRVGNQNVITQVEAQTPENMLKFGERILMNPQGRIVAEKEFSDLSKEKQAEFAQQAILAGGSADEGINMYLADNYGKQHWKNSEIKKAVNIPQGKGSGTKKEEVPDNNLLVDAFKGMWNKNPNYVQKDANGLTTFKVPYTKLQTYQHIDKNVPMESGPNQDVVTEKFEVIEDAVVDPATGQWYYTSNRTKNMGQGKTIGTYKNMVPMSLAMVKEIMLKTALDTGEVTTSEVEKYLGKKGYVNTDGSLNFDAGSSDKPTSHTVFFEDTEYTVPLKDIDKSKGFPIAKLPDGRKVKYEEATKTWVEYKDGAKSNPKQEDLRKKYNY